MPWVRIDETLPRHPKFLRVGIRGIGLFVVGLCYANEYLTDGTIPLAAVSTVAGEDMTETIDILVNAGLWTHTPAGLQIHDFHEYQPTKQHVLKQRKKAAERKHLFENPELKAAIRRRDGDICRYCGKLVNWGDRRGALGGTFDHIRPNGATTFENLVVSCRGCNAGKRDRTPKAAGLKLLPPQLLRRKTGTKSELSSVAAPDPTRPDPTPTLRTHTEGFKEFWAVYPKKVGKDEAERVWRRLRPDEATTTRIIAAVLAQVASESWREDGGRWIPHPKTWLHQGRWKDEGVEGGTMSESDIYHELWRAVPVQHRAWLIGATGPNGAGVVRLRVVSIEKVDPFRGQLETALEAVSPGATLQIVGKP